MKIRCKFLILFLYSKTKKKRKTNDKIQIFCYREKSSHKIIWIWYCFISLKDRVMSVTEFSPLSIGPLKIWPPVVLAPMAGITNEPFRELCRQFGAGLYVSEMITSRLLVEKNERTLQMISFRPEEKPRSIQLYGTDPYYIGEAISSLVNEHQVDHIDLNFGCPVRKITRKGGGAAIPLKQRLLRALIATAVNQAGKIPVTVKFRIGINEQYQTYLTSGKIAQEEGCAAVALHARTAAQLYSGEARWEAIATLKNTLSSIPVLGNGDIWEAKDAIRMMYQTGCDGVVIGRGCLGRPWIFRDLIDLFEGRTTPEMPSLGEVAEIIKNHARLLCDWVNEKTAMQMIRKHCNWYLNGFPDVENLRKRLLQIQSFGQLDEIPFEVEGEKKYDPDAMRTPRGKITTTQKVALPDGYLNHLDDASPPHVSAEELISGG
jgi:nifR3 family TIM-barrel protein